MVILESAIHHIYINCWFPLYRWSVMEKQVTSTPQYLEMGGGGGSGYLYLHYWPPVDREPTINVDMVNRERINATKVSIQTWPRGYKTWVHSQTQQWLAACGHVSASSQSLHFILSLSLYSSFITSGPGFKCRTHYISLEKLYLCLV